MIGIYHSRDLDGYASGAILKLKFPDINLIGFDYGEDIGKKLEKYESQEVIMIDVSLPMGQMADLNQWAGGKLTWIDHHISAILEYRKAAPQLPWLDFKTCLQDGMAACEIAWSEFFPNNTVPAAVTMLGEYDTWRKEDTKKWYNLILPFQYGMRMLVSKPEDFPVSLFFSDTEDVYMSSILRKGEAVYKYQSKENDKRLMLSSFMVDLPNGVTALAVNGGNAMMADNEFFLQSKCDVLLTFTYTLNRWVFSLFSRENGVDCSLIAKGYGGGGHRNAAGFEVHDPTFIQQLISSSKKLIQAY